MRRTLPWVALGALVMTGCSAPAPAPVPAPTPAPVASASASASPTPPAARTVVLAKGDPVGADVPCQGTSGTPCARVVVTPSGFVGAYECRYFSDQASAPWLTLPMSGDERNSKAYYGYAHTVWVVCDGVQSNKVAW